MFIVYRAISDIASFKGFKEQAGPFETEKETEGKEIELNVSGK